MSIGFSSKVLRISLIAALAIGLPFIASAQITGDLRGTVIDSGGASVAGAAVVVKSKETGDQRTLESDSEGRFASGLLRIGAYRVTAAKAGFSTAEADIEIRAGEVDAMRIQIEPGQVTDTVSVTDAVSLLDVENAQLQSAVTGAAIQEIPVSRDLNTFAMFSAGTAPISKNNPFLGSGSFNVNGMRGRGNNITVDGITATDASTTGTSSNLGAVNFSEVKEVKVITNNFSAEFGRNMGSQVQYLTKNGTNQLHGEAFEYFRNDKLNARPFFDTTGSPNVIRRNDFGFQVGGPVLIPKLADLRNRTFWLASYNGIQQRGAAGTSIALVPTPAMISQVTDPTSKALLNQYQLPTSPTGQLNTSTPSATRAYQTSIRIDQNIGTRDAVWGRFSRYQATDQAPALSFISTNLPGFGASAISKPMQVTLAETHVFGASAVNEFRFGHGRNDVGYIIDPNHALGPRIVLTNGEVDRFGVWEGYPQGRDQRTYQFNDTVSLVRGRHNIKVGGEYYLLQANSFADTQVRGVITFPTWADFAAGLPSRFQQRFGSSHRDFQMNNYAAFFQDDWKVLPSLTLNLGLRMERAGSPIEQNGLISNLNLNDSSPLGAAGSGPLGNLVTGQPSYRPNTNWGPRVGFAWSPGNKKTVIRGGYGIAYDFLFLNPITNQRGLPPFIVTADQSGQAAFTGANSYANFVAGTAKLQTDTAGTAGAFNPNAVNFGAVNPAIDQGLRNPQAQQWSMGVQHEVAGVVLKATYVGTKGNYLQRARDLNFIASPQAPAMSVADETARLAAFKSSLSAASGNVSTRSNRIDGRYNAVMLLDNSASSNYHSAQFEMQKRLSFLTLSANYTFAKSIDNGSDALGVLINDSATLQNPRNLGDNRAVSQFDLTHRFVFMHTWALPWGNHSNSRFVRLALGGWSFAGVTTIRSGLPVTLDAGGRRAVTPIPVIGGGDAVRPNAAGPFNVNWLPAGSAGSANGLVNPDGVQSISAYASSLGLSQPLLGNFGTLGRNTLRLNGERNFDWNFMKSIPVGERRSFQLRGEFYNIFNNTSFQDVVRNITNTSFGQYTSVSQDSRNVQLGARFIF